MPVHHNTVTPTPPSSQHFPPLPAPSSPPRPARPLALQRIGLELPFRDLLNARLVCAHWRAHVSAAVRCLPHGLLELDAQPRLEPWTHTLRHVAACLPSLAELMTYVSSRVPQEELTHQLHSLSTFLPQLRKLELR